MYLLAYMACDWMFTLYTYIMVLVHVKKGTDCLGEVTHLDAGRLGVLGHNQQVGLVFNLFWLFESVGSHRRLGVWHSQEAEYLSIVVQRHGLAKQNSRSGLDDWVRMNGGVSGRRQCQQHQKQGTIHLGFEFNSVERYERRECDKVLVSESR